MKYALRLTITLLASGLLLAPAWAQVYSHDPDSQIVGGPKHSTYNKLPGGYNHPNAPEKLTAKDKQFVKNVYQANKAMVVLGDMARNKAQNQQVSQYGTRMVQDHEKIQAELTSLVNPMGINLPSGLGAPYVGQKEYLSKIAGRRFNMPYMKRMVQDNQKLLNEFQRAANSAEDIKIKEFAEKYIPIVNSHAEEAKKILDNLGSPGSGGGKPAVTNNEKQTH